jgi:hypothetical protein
MSRSPGNRFGARYSDIVADRRLVDRSALHAAGTRISVSLSTMESIPRDGGTQLIETEPGAYRDGQDGAEPPARRQGGTTERRDGLTVYRNHQFAGCEDTRGRALEGRRPATT